MRCTSCRGGSLHPLQVNFVSQGTERAVVATTKAGVSTYGVKIILWNKVLIEVSIQTQPFNDARPSTINGIRQRGGELRTVERLVEAGHHE